MKTHKFMQTLGYTLSKELSKVARSRGITLQQLIRAVIVPEWMKFNSNPKVKVKRKRRK